MVCVGMFDDKIVILKFEWLCLYLSGLLWCWVVLINGGCCFVGLC